LADSGVCIIDAIGREAFDRICENDEAEYFGDQLWINGKYLCSASVLDKTAIESKMEEASENLCYVLDGFVSNTLDYAGREKDAILGPVALPDIKARLEGRHVLIVTRGKNYREDLKTIRCYIEEVNPVIIGVDGGGDALLECGYRPDILVGDMDSASDDCIRRAKEIVVHAYTNSDCPGMERIKTLGLSARAFAFPGTSEDIAMIIAFEKKAELIVTVGSHTNVIDFLEKGREGMASTMLVRMKAGYKIVDAKGVSELYRNRIYPGYFVALFASVLLPIALLARMSPLIQEIYNLIFLRIRLMLGF